MTDYAVYVAVVTQPRDSAGQLILEPTPNPGTQVVAYLTRTEWVLMPHPSLELSSPPRWILWTRFQRSFRQRAVWKYSVVTEANKLYTAVEHVLDREGSRMMLGPITFALSVADLAPYTGSSADWQTPYMVLNRVDRVAPRHGFIRS